VPPLVGQALDVAAQPFAERRLGPLDPVRKQFLDRHQQWRPAHDARLPVDHVGQLGERAEMVAGFRLGGAQEQLGAHGLGPELGLPAGEQERHVQPRVPHRQVALAGEGRHGLPVLPHGGHDEAPALGPGQAAIAAEDRQAGGQPLDVPLPRAGQGLVEVVDVEDQGPFGRPEATEVAQVGVAAQLHPQPGIGGGGEVGGHHGSGAAEERER
jgi:hypothetical protein